MEPIDQYASLENAIQDWNELIDEEQRNGSYDSNPGLRDVGLMNQVGTLILLWMGFESWTNENAMSSGVSRPDCPFYIFEQNSPCPVIFLNKSDSKIPTEAELKNHFSEEEMIVLQKYSYYFNILDGDEKRRKHPQSWMKWKY